MKIAVEVNTYSPITNQFTQISDKLNLELPWLLTERDKRPKQHKYTEVRLVRNKVNGQFRRLEYETFETEQG